MRSAPIAFCSSTMQPVKARRETLGSMTRTYMFEGVDDDLVLVHDDGEPDKLDAYDGAQFHLVAHAGQMQVAVNIDTDSGCWHIATGQTDEVHPLPAWPVTIEQSPDSGYSARLTVEAPADAELVRTA